MKTLQTVAALLLSVCLLPSPAFSESAGTGRPWRVFILHSYDAGYVWTRNVDQGLRAALVGLNVAFESFYLDAKRADAAVQARAGKAAWERIRAFDPDVVVAADDAAQAWVVRPFLAGRERPQVIFCGVNAPPASYGYPASNVSGVRERFHFRESFELLRRLAPEARSVAFLTDDSDTGRSVAEDLAAHAPYALDLERVRTVRGFQAWKAEVAACQKTSDALALGVYHTLRDEATGRLVPPEEVMAWTNAENRLPTLGFADFTPDHGVLCGVLESAHEQGYLAGLMTREVLESGRAAGELPVRGNATGVVFVNLRAAERLRMTVPFEIIEAAGVVVE
ncbi:hypothetical protein NNJEOMEG_00411 [Fundidesulfovibrio magnetotacticus]|uniref:ABC-type sugar transport system, periplasmic component n=1 Tax=Fundidesulfovibrio magnetotacticus TaxID=2730080 RepID=A0A6V8LS19_9BACT|nr:ABC transporter substrate binding protein [Fundidesulfovibrio magnetotacticus]GFK92586.1 hypothetical protein NNJEOMEG_00411 [Fundidesulfovibrio magnetotacticus]